MKFCLDFRMRNRRMYWADCIRGYLKVLKARFIVISRDYFED